MSTEHPPVQPTIQRIRDTHSRLPASWDGWRSDRHSAYGQSEWEHCYICVLLGALGEMEAALDHIIDEAVDRWHGDMEADGCGLDEWLGLTPEQYAVYVEQGTAALAAKLHGV